MVYSQFGLHSVNSSLENLQRVTVTADVIYDDTNPNANATFELLTIVFV